MKPLRLSAVLAALTLTASATCAAGIDLSNVLGPSGGYTSQAFYQGMLGGQPMTAAQQSYAEQEGQLRQLGYLSELGGDIALGQIFYHIAYGITPPPSALDLASGGSDLRPPSITPSGLGAGASDAGNTGAALTNGGYGTGASDVGDTGGYGAVVTADVGDTGAGLTLTTVNAGVGPATAVPEASTWAMMLMGFAGLGFAGYRSSRRCAAGLGLSVPEFRPP